ncbi:MAG TPA: EAL domain-containing response regulator [Gammaproteobacteria bacterium]|nr:EAL domain-containing response regulator [Gammaproteobacteria bacterium]
MSKERFLVIDDEADVAEFIGNAGRVKNFEVRVTTDGQQFKTLLRSFNPSIISLDLMMPELDGIEILRFLADEKSNAALLLVSGMDVRTLHTAERLAKSLNLNILGSMQKPIMLDDFDTIIEKGMKSGSQISAERLKAAIYDRELFLLYQPKLSLREDKITLEGVEALVRWQHPEKGVIPPFEFIPLAEETGLIAPLTEYVLDEALEQVNKWQTDHGLTLDVSVNLAPQLLGDTSIPDRMNRLLSQHTVKSQQLTIEITETGLMQDIPTNVANLMRFRVKGMNISIDDFGTGYSSLVQIFRMPFNELKIDKSFVMELDDNNEARTIVHAIIDLAHNLGLSVCAEGIETESSLRYLQEQGCDLGQGFFMSRPIPAEEIPAWNVKWNKRSRLKKV